MKLLEMLVYHEMPPLWCKACGSFKPFDEFFNSTNGNGKEYRCRECRRSGRRIER